MKTLRQVAIGFGFAGQKIYHQKMYLPFVFFCRFIESGQFAPARAAPRRPEVYDYGLADKIGKFNFFAVYVRHRKILIIALLFRSESPRIGRIFLR